MPLDTGFGTMSVGKDYAIDIVQSGGQVLRLGNVTDFDAKPNTKDLKSEGIDGIVRHAIIPGGWTVTLSIDRQDRGVDDFFAQFEADYYAGKTLRNMTITESINEADGTISQWRYVGVALKLDDNGKRKADEYVKMKMSGHCAKRLRVQ